jgi:hypothetical protein
VLVCDDVDWIHLVAVETALHTVGPFNHTQTLIFSNLPNPSSHTMMLGSAQNTRNLPECKKLAGS